MQKVESNIILKGVSNRNIIYRNFKGEKSKYNKNGIRTFSVILEDNLADQLRSDGWNVKFLQPREEGDPARPYLDVKVVYGSMPPKVVIISPSTGRKTYIGEDEMAMFDWSIFEKVDIAIRPYNWGPIGGEYGVAAYLKTMYATIEEDEFEADYRPEASDLVIDTETDPDDEMSMGGY